MTLTKRVAGYAVGLRYEAIGDEVIDRTKQLLLDFLGVAFGGRALAGTSAALLRGVRALAGKEVGPCTVVGERAGFAPQYAALANGALAHSMDFDDTHRDAVMHQGTPLFAALLAIAEERGCSGRDLLAATVAGYEIGGKLGTAHGERVHLRGFHPTATTGIFAVTAAAARLSGLDEAQTASALGLALSMSSGTAQFAESGGANKPFQVGLAAHNALYAVALAGEGFPGTGAPLEGTHGYYAAYAEPGANVHAIDFGERPGEVLKVGVKPYPSCRYTHGTIDGVAALVCREELAAEEIEAIEVLIPPAGYQLVGSQPDVKRRPGTVVDAQFSAYFAAASTALDRGYSWAAYDRLSDPRVCALMDRVSVQASDGLSGMATALRMRARGREWSLEVPLPKGEPETPLTWDDIEGKFMSLATQVVDPGRAHEIALQVRALDGAAGVKDLAGLLRG